MCSVRLRRSQLSLRHLWIKTATHTLLCLLVFGARGWGGRAGGLEGQDTVGPRAPHNLLNDKSSHRLVKRTGRGGRSKKVPAAWHPRGPPGCTEQVLESPRQEPHEASANATRSHTAELPPATRLRVRPPPQL